MRKDQRDNLTLFDLMFSVASMAAVGMAKGLSELYNVLPSLGNQDSAGAGKFGNGLGRK